MILLIFLIIYLLFVVFFIALSLFNIFHAIRFGIDSSLNKLMLKTYIFVSVVLLISTIFVVSAIDWTAHSNLLPSGGLLPTTSF